jgi:hypothetical protein
VGLVVVPLASADVATFAAPEGGGNNAPAAHWKREQLYAEREKAARSTEELLLSFILK